MRVLIATDAWHPQVNGVVRTLTSLAASADGLGVTIDFLTPDGFPTIALPTYASLRVALPNRREIARRIEAARPDAIHIATEGPLGGAARAHCLRQGLAFTTAFHTRFPEILARALHVPERWGYAWFRRFHAKSSGIMVPSAGMHGILEGHGFDPEAVPDPTAPENLELPCGRGLMLMRSFMSRVEFNGRGNQVTMEKERAMAGAE